MNAFQADALARIGTDAPPITAYSKLYDYDGDGNLAYEGWANSASSPAANQAVWTIKKYVYTAGEISGVLWARGGMANVVWDNRATEGYI